MTKVNVFCNRCNHNTMRNEGENCPYHQEVLVDSEGISYLKYDEFDQDGEAY